MPRKTCFNCVHCGLCPAGGLWARSRNKFYCDEACFKAWSRDDLRDWITQKIQERDECHAAPDANPWTKLLVRHLQLEKLLYAGCLKRQTNAQLQMILNRLKDHARVVFNYMDEHKDEFSDGDYLIGAKYCGDEIESKYVHCVDVWASP